MQDRASVGYHVPSTPPLSNLVGTGLGASAMYRFPTLSPFFLFGAGIVTIVATALALASQGVPRLPLILLLGTILSAYSHALPFGPLGSTCFFLAALWLELAWRPSLAHQHSPFQQTDAFVNQGEKTAP
jgi:hypothetical protein